MFTVAGLLIMVGGGLMLVNTIAGCLCMIAGLLVVLKALKVKTTEPISDGIARKIITVENYDYEFQEKGSQLILRLNPEITASPGVRVEDIQVELKGKRYDTDWEPMKETISGNIGHYVYTELPKSLKKGKYQARVIAHIDNKEWPSPPFTVEYMG